MPPPGLQEHGFSLHNATFHDTTALQYGWYPSNLPSKCDCSNNFTMEQHSHVPRDVFPPSGTMKFTISWPTSSQKYVMKCALNRTCSQLCRTNHLEQLPTHRTGARLDISANGVWGGRFEKMYRSSTPTPPPTGIRHFPAIQKAREGEYTHRGYAKWSIRPSLHLFFRPQEEWGERQPASANFWLRCSLRRGIIHAGAV